MLEPALGDHLLSGHEAALEPCRVGHRKLHPFALGHPHVFERLFERPCRRRHLQDVELLPDRRLQLLVAGIGFRGHQQAIELVLHDELAVVAVSVTVVLGGGFFGFLRVQVGHGLDLKAAGRGRRLEQALAAVVQSENSRCQTFRPHTNAIRPQTLHLARVASPRASGLDDGPAKGKAAIVKGQALGDATPDLFDSTGSLPVAVTIRNG